MLKTRFGRNTTFGLIVGIALDVALAFVLATWLSGGDFWLSFFGFLAVLWLGPSLFAIKGSLYKVVLFLLTKNSVRRTLVQEFRKAKLPLLSGTSFNDPADLYFQEVAADETLPKSAADYAVMTIGQVGIIPRYSMVDSVVAMSHLDAALAIYFDELRRDGVRPHGQ